MSLCLALREAARPYSVCRTKSTKIAKAIKALRTAQPKEVGIFASRTTSISSRPGSDRVHRVVIDVLLRDAGFLRHLERVVAAFDHVQLCRESMLLDDPPNLFFSSERIARALHEQHWSFDFRQMFITHLVQSTRRMHWIAKENQAVYAF